MRNSIADPTQQSSSPSSGIPCSHKRGYGDRVNAVFFYDLLHRQYIEGVQR